MPRLVILAVDEDRFAELLLDRVPEPPPQEVAQEILDYIRSSASLEVAERVAREFRGELGMVVPPRDPARVIEAARRHGVELPSYDVGYWAKRVKLRYARELLDKWRPEHWSVAKQIEQITEMCRRHGVRYLYRSYSNTPPAKDVVDRLWSDAVKDLSKKGVSRIKVFVFTVPDEEVDPPEDGEGGIEVRPLRLAGAVAGMALLLLAASRRG